MAHKMEEFIIVFTSYNYSTLLYSRLIKKNCQVELITTPCKLSAGCTQSIKFSSKDVEEIKDQINKSSIIFSGVYKVVKRSGINTYEPVSIEEIQ